MCNCHSILECCVMFSGVKLSIRPFNLFQQNLLEKEKMIFPTCHQDNLIVISLFLEFLNQFC